MPDPEKYQDEESWMGACVPALKKEGKDQDEAVAQCINMWNERGEKKAEGTEKELRAESPEKEVRVLPVSEFRFDDNDGKPKFEGYAAVFNRWSEDLGGFRERIRPSAFRDAVKQSDVRALFNHDANYVLGRSTSGTLELKEDNKGLHVSNTPPDTQWARDLMTSVSRGDISQMSFGFTVGEDEWREDRDGVVSRTINKIDRLFDISVVTYPAYPDTSVALRSLEKIKEEKERPIFTHVESKDIEETKNRVKIELSKDDWNEVRDIIIEKISELVNRNLKNTSEAEPMQGEEENTDDLKAAIASAEVVDLTGEEDSHKEGEISEPMQGENEVRDYWKQ